MDKFFQENFVHGTSDTAGQTVAGWLNKLAEEYAVLEWQMVPIGNGHGTLVVARCVPHTTEEDKQYMELYQQLPMMFQGNQ